MEPTPFKQLPSELQKVIVSSDTNVSLAAIALKFNLDEEKESDLSLVVTRHLFGLLPRTDLERALFESLTVPQNTSRDIAEELDMKIFAKVRTELDTLYKNRISNKTLTSSLPPPPPPPPGARRSIPTRDIKTVPNVPQTNTPSLGYRPIQPIPPVVSSKPPITSAFTPPQPQSSTNNVEQKKPEPLSFHTPVSTVPANLPIARSSTANTSPFNTPRMLPNIQKTPPPTISQSPKPTIPTSPIGDILSAKLTGTIQATNSEPTLTSSQKTSRGYGSIDPYRELPE